LRTGAVQFGLAALALLAGCTHYPLGNPQATIDHAPGSLPATLALAPEPNWPVIEVAVDGQPGYRFLVDSGAMAAVLFVHDRTRTLAKRASGEIKVGGAGSGERAQASLLRGTTLAIGPLMMRDMTLLAIDASAIPRLGDADAFDLDGIIGYDLLARFPVRVDPRARTLAILAPGTPPPAGAVILPLEQRGRNAYVSLPVAVAAGAPPQPANLHVDTGFTGHLQLVDSDASPFRPPARGWRSVGAGVQGETHGRLASVAKVDIAGGTIERVPTVFSRGDAASGRHGRLGASLLARFAYTIDLPSERLLLEPRADSFVTPAQGFIGMTVTPIGEGARVRYVQPGSPAEHAGFTSGDRLVSIDGVATAGLTRRDLAEKLQVDAGRRVEVCRRDGAGVDCRSVMAGDLARPPS
jgi:hypothetical protein